MAGPAVLPLLSLPQVPTRIAMRRGGCEPGVLTLHASAAVETIHRTKRLFFIRHGESKCVPPQPTLAPRNPTQPHATPPHLILRPTAPPRAILPHPNPPEPTLLHPATSRPSPHRTKSPEYFLPFPRAVQMERRQARQEVLHDGQAARPPT